MVFFFFNDTATTEIYTLSLHDALPISLEFFLVERYRLFAAHETALKSIRSEEHTSELQSRSDLVCRLLLEKKKPNQLYNDDTDEPVAPTGRAHTHKHTSS